MALGKNIKARRLQLGLTQDELSKLVGTAQGNIAALENRDSKSSTLLLELARALQMSADDLSKETEKPRGIGGHSSNTQNKNGIMKSVDAQIVSGSFDVNAFIPVISWEDASEWGKTMGINTPDRFIDRTPRMGLNPRIFGLRLMRDCMASTKPGEVSFFAGLTIYIDPDQRSPRDGDFVVIKREGSDTNDTLFRKYTINRDGDPCLKALNPKYPCIHDNYRILGKFIGSWFEP